jgi:glycosyltransferase involved in cell wall biosynthesis
MAMAETDKLRLVVVPSDPIEAYERAGYDWLERYYNPQGMFQEVFALSPLEKGERRAYGMTIIGVPERAFTGMLRRLRPDVVRAYGGYWPADLVCRHRLPDVPVVVSVHDTNPASLHKSVRYADLVICMSNIVAQKVIALGTNPNRVRILPNRVDTDVFHPIRDGVALQALAKRFPPGKHILHVGRKSEQKNLDTLIRALELLPSDYSCIFVGQGDRSPYLSLAESLGVGERCFWIDAIRNSELPLWYSWCDCMCTPSRWEGFGIVFIEAAACGAAIVTSDIAPMNEYLTHDVSACLVKEYENPWALAEAIRKVCEDTEYRRTICAGAVKAAQPFDRRIVDAAEVAIYREAMKLGALSLSRRLEITTWQAQEAAMCLVGKALPERLVRVVGRRMRRIWEDLK